MRTLRFVGVYVIVYWVCMDIYVCLKFCKSVYLDVTMYIHGSGQEGKVEQDKEGEDRDNK